MNSLRGVFSGLLVAVILAVGTVGCSSAPLSPDEAKLRNERVEEKIFRAGSRPARS